jgi:hypothetical protein
VALHCMIIANINNFYWSRVYLNFELLLLENHSTDFHETWEGRLLLQSVNKFQQGLRVMVSRLRMETRVQSLKCCFI